MTNFLKFLLTFFFISLSLHAEVIKDPDSDSMIKHMKTTIVELQQTKLKLENELNSEKDDSKKQLLKNSLILNKWKTKEISKGLTYALREFDFKNNFRDTEIEIAPKSLCPSPCNINIALKPSSEELKKIKYYIYTIDEKKFTSFSPEFQLTMNFTQNALAKSTRLLIKNNAPISFKVNIDALAIINESQSIPFKSRKSLYVTGQNSNTDTDLLLRTVNPYGKLYLSSSTADLEIKGTINDIPLIFKKNDNDSATSTTFEAIVPYELHGPTAILKLANKTYEISILEKPKIPNPKIYIEAFLDELIDLKIVLFSNKTLMSKVDETGVRSIDTSILNLKKIKALCQKKSNDEAQTIAELIDQAVENERKSYGFISQMKLVEEYSLIASYIGNKEAGLGKVMLNNINLFK